MSKIIKSLSILLGASFLLLTGCNQNNSKPSSKASFSSSFYNPSYGDRLPEDYSSKSCFTYDHGHVLDLESTSGCLLFSDYTSLQEYTASLEAKADEPGNNFEEAINYFNFLDESYFNDNYLLVTPELYLPNGLYSVIFDGLYLKNDVVTVRLVTHKSQGAAPEVVTYYYFKVSISKNYQINSARVVVDQQYSEY